MSGNTIGQQESVDFTSEPQRCKSLVKNEIVDSKSEAVLLRIYVF